MRAIVGVVLLSACSPYVKGMRIQEVREASRVMLRCPEARIRVVERERDWLAAGCGKEASCDTYRGSWACRPREPAADKAKKEIALQTACPKDSIRVGPPQEDGAATAFRLVACEKAYVCKVTSERTDCALALDANALTLPEEARVAPESTEGRPTILPAKDCPQMPGESRRQHVMRCRDHPN